MRMMRLLSITVSCTATMRGFTLDRRRRPAEGPLSRRHADCAVRNPKIPLPDQPVVYDTAEGQRIRVVVHASGLSHPWSLAFLPDPSSALGQAA